MLFDSTAESALLGAAMLNADAAYAVAATDSVAFHDPKHRQIAERITTLVGQGKAVDMTTVVYKTSLTSFPRLLVQELVTDCPFPAHWPDYLRAVKEGAAERQYAQTLQDITTGLAQGELTRAEAQAAMEQLLDRTPVADAHAEGLTLGLSSALDHLEAAFNGDLAVRGLPTGYRDLNDIIGGFQGGSLYAIGARTGHGKTMFGLNLSLLAAKADYRVLFVSIEQSRREIMHRLLAMESGVSFHDMRRGIGTDADWRKIADAADALAGLPWYGVYDNVTAGDVRRLIREHLPQIVFIDYLQLMSVGGGREQRWSSLEATARTLRGLAQGNDCAVVVMAQLNREGVGDNPGLHNFREASIEQDCDVAMLLVPGDNGIIEVRVEKNRHGPTGVATLRWYKAKGVMEDYVVEQRVVIPADELARRRLGQD